MNGITSSDTASCKSKPCAATARPNYDDVSSERGPSCKADGKDIAEFRHRAPIGRIACQGCVVPCGSTVADARRQHKLYVKAENSRRKARKQKSNQDNEDDKAHHKTHRFTREQKIKEKRHQRKRKIPMRKRVENRKRHNRRRYNRNEWQTRQRIGKRNDQVKRYADDSDSRTSSHFSSDVCTSSTDPPHFLDSDYNLSLADRRKLTIKVIKILIMTCVFAHMFREGSGFRPFYFLKFGFLSKGLLPRTSSWQ